MRIVLCLFSGLSVCMAVASTPYCELSRSIQAEYRPQQRALHWGGVSEKINPCQQISPYDVLIPPR